MNIYEQFEDSPIIAAVKDDAGLEACLKSDCRIVFILYGTICNIGEIVKKNSRFRANCYGTSRFDFWTWK